MGYVITSASFATPSGYIKSSENAALVASRIGQYTHPYRIWQGSDCVSGTTYVGIDYGTATALVAVILDHINVASVKIQAHTADSWATPDYDTGAIAVSQDVWDGRYKLYQTVSATKRYWRVVANTGTTTDGSSTMRLGAWLGLTAITTWTTNPGFPYEVIPSQAVIANDDFAAGIDEPIELGKRYATLRLAQPVTPLAMKSTLATVIGSYSQATPLVFFRNNGDSSEVYICHRLGNASMALAGPNHYGLSGLVLREYA